MVLLSEKSEQELPTDHQLICVTDTLLSPASEFWINDQLHGGGLQVYVGRIKKNQPGQKC